MLLFFDWTYILVILGVVVCLGAQGKMKSTYAKYCEIRSSSGLTGADVARKILAANGVYGVTVQPVAGSLTDHYDPRNKTVNLSEDVYARTDIAALGVAAHECGHALQDFEEYAPLKFRTAFVPVANFGARFSWILIIIGLFVSIPQFNLITVGIVLFALTVLLQLVTLPVEKNASSRALLQLENLGILAEEEKDGTKKVLGAAGLTYVAAAASGILQLLRLIILFGGRNRD